MYLWVNTKRVNSASANQWEECYYHIHTYKHCIIYGVLRCTLSNPDAWLCSVVVHGGLDICAHGSPCPVILVYHIGNTNIYYFIINGRWPCMLNVSLYCGYINDWPGYILWIEDMPSLRTYSYWWGVKENMYIWEVSSSQGKISISMRLTLWLCCEYNWGLLSAILVLTQLWLSYFI